MARSTIQPPKEWPTMIAFDRGFCLAVNAMRVSVSTIVGPLAMRVAAFRRP
jgi:hypothetical protein